MTIIDLNTLEFEIPASSPKRFIRYNELVKEFDEKVKSGELTLGDIKGTYILTLKSIVSFIEKDYNSAFMIVDDEVVDSFCDFTRKIVHEYLRLRENGVNKKVLFRLRYITECIYFLIPYNKFVEGNYLSDIKRGEDGLIELGRSLGIVPELLDEDRWGVFYRDNYVNNIYRHCINSNRQENRKSKSSRNIANLQIVTLNPPTSSRSDKFNFNKTLKEKSLKIYRGLIRDRLCVYNIKDDISLLHGISQSMDKLQMSSLHDKLILDEEMYRRVVNTYRQYFSGDTHYIYDTFGLLKTYVLRKSIYLISLISDLKYEDFEYIINSIDFNEEFRNHSDNSGDLLEGDILIWIDGFEDLISEYSKRNGISKSIEKFLMGFTFKDRRKNKVDSIRLYIPNIDTVLVDMIEDLIDGKELRGPIKLSDYPRIKSQEEIYSNYIGALKRGAFIDEEGRNESIGYKLILPKKVKVKLIDFLRLVITHVSDLVENRVEPRVLSIVISLDNYDRLHRLDDLLRFFRFFTIDMTEVFYDFTRELEPKLKEFDFTEYLTSESYLRFFSKTD